MTSKESIIQRLAQLKGHVADQRESDVPAKASHTFQEGASILLLDNAKKRNALSHAILQDLRAQLLSMNTSPVDGQIKLLPPFKPEILADIESVFQRTSKSNTEKYGWLIDSEQWRMHRAGLPRVIVLRSDGPVFCSGHDLAEVQGMNYGEVQHLFALCAEVMSLIQRSPVPVIGMIQGLATAAGAQLALTTDLPIAHGSTEFRLPGSVMGLPCISPSTAVSRKIGNAFAYRMLALTKAHRADELPGKPVDIVDDDTPLENAVSELVYHYTQKTAAQSQALGKWAYWTQTGIDSYEDATLWAGRAMALLAQTSDAQEGMKAFLEKRKPHWRT